MATAKLSSPATSLLAGGRARRSAPARRATVIRAAAGSYSDELVSTAVSPGATASKPYVCPFPSV
jgi:fructose-bisphosphate aldolase, class I